MSIYIEREREPESEKFMGQKTAGGILELKDTIAIAILAIWDHTAGNYNQAQ